MIPSTPSPSGKKPTQQTPMPLGNDMTTADPVSPMKLHDLLARVAPNARYQFLHKCFTEVRTKCPKKNAPKGSKDITTITFKTAAADTGDIMCGRKIGVIVWVSAEDWDAAQKPDWTPQLSKS